MSGFQMIFDKMAAICLDFNFFDKMAAICPHFKWLGFGISDPVQSLDHFATQPVFNSSKSQLVWISDPH